MRWRTANKVVRKRMAGRNYRYNTWLKALKKGQFKTGYLGVWGRYSKRYPKGCKRPADYGPDGVLKLAWNHLSDSDS